MVLQQLLWNRFAIKFVELWLGVKKIDVRRPPRHEEKNDALCFRSMMEVWQAPLPSVKLVIQQGRKRYRTNPTRRPPQKSAAGKIC